VGYGLRFVRHTQKANDPEADSGFRVFAACVCCGHARNTALVYTAS